MKSRVEESAPGINNVDMVKIIRTGKEARSHENIIVYGHIL